MSSHTRNFLLARKKDLLEQLKPLRAIEAELDEVLHLLKELDDKEKRHGREAPGHEPGCRCRECDPSW